MNKRIILLMTALVLAGGLFAQHNEEVTVEGTYRPKINKVDKIKLTPAVPTPSFSMPSSEVEPKTTDRKFDIELEKLGAAAYTGKDDPKTQPTQNFLMAGMGTRISPLFMYRHDSQLTKDVSLGVGISHLSSWLKMKDHPNSGFMNNLFDVRAGAKLPNHQLSAKVFYQNDLYHYYGYRLSDTLIPAARVDELCPKVINNTLGVSALLSGTENRVQQLQHSFGLGYQYSFGRANEHYADVNGKLAWADNWWGNRAYPQKVGLDFGMQFDSYEALLNEGREVRSQRFLLGLNPYFESKADFYSLRLGVRVDYTSSDSVKVSFRPDVKGSLYVFDRKLEIYAGLGGGKQLHSTNELFVENPFISTGAYQYDYQYVKLAFEAGLRTTVAEKVELHSGMRYAKTNNDWFFVQAPESLAGLYGVFNQYAILYDNTETVSVVADARCKITEAIAAELGVAYNHVTAEQEQHAWYRPAFETRIKVEYAFDERLAFNASLLYRGGIYAKVYKNYNIWETETLKNVFDLSLGADYKLNEQLAAFVTLDNVTDCKYQLYYAYPVTGIQVFAGMKIKF